MCNHAFQDIFNSYHLPMQLFSVCFDKRPRRTCYFLFSLMSCLHQLSCCLHVIFKITLIKTEAVLRWWKETAFSPREFQSHVLSLTDLAFFFLLTFFLRKTIHKSVPCLRFLIRISKNDLLRGSINESSFRTSLCSHHSLAGRTKSTCVSSVSAGEAVSLFLFPWKKVSLTFLRL